MLRKAVYATCQLVPSDQGVFSSSNTRPSGSSWGGEHVEQLDQAAMRWWTPNERAYARLAELHRAFPLGRHDVVLRLDRMRPHSLSGLFALQRSRQPRHQELLKTLDQSRARLLRD